MGNIIQAAHQQAAAEAMIQAEIRATAREAYSRIIEELFFAWDVTPSADKAGDLRKAADFCWKAAQYVYVPAGIAKVDDEKLWKGNDQNV